MGWDGWDWYILDKICANAGDVEEFIGMCYDYGLDPIEVAEDTGVFSVDEVEKALSEENALTKFVSSS